MKDYGEKNKSIRILRRKQGIRGVATKERCEDGESCKEGKRKAKREKSCQGTSFEELKVLTHYLEMS